jgi:hypothetical protein
MSDIPTLTKRRLQAQVIGPIYAEMVAEIGEERASAILDAAIRKAAIAEGKEFAKRAPGRAPCSAVSSRCRLATT